MFLKPKKFKYKKIQKQKKVPKFDFRASDLKFGTLGLKAVSFGRINAKQIEAARQAISRKIKRKGKIWIRIFPHKSVTLKPNEARMGKGKGSVKYWATSVKAGTVLFEVCGISEDLGSSALKTGGAKLPVKTLIFK
uniref:Ribosomal protein L16 n=1 Tax=Toxarium undulatum TaxID=210620 RepID=A0A2U9GI46_9STRA|nr:ribosomal protein L16 [Toxarium undulatum]AWQ64138.1 ribosomal protein L16 [Toxarium undulatum]